MPNKRPIVKYLKLILLFAVASPESHAIRKTLRPTGSKYQGRKCHETIVS